jgi:hypothetical protein
MEFKLLKHVFLASRVKKDEVYNISDEGCTVKPIVRALERDIDLICNKDKRALVEEGDISKYKTCYDSARVLGVRSRDIVLANCFENTLKNFNKMAEEDNSASLLVIPRDKELLDKYLQKICLNLSLEIEPSKLAYPAYWQAWHLDLHKGNVQIIGYTPSEIISRTEYVNGRGCAASYSRDFIVDRDTKLEVCIGEDYNPDPYGMNDKEY